MIDCFILLQPTVYSTLCMFLYLYDHDYGPYFCILYVLYFRRLNVSSR